MRVISNLQRYGLATIACGLALALARLWDAPSSCFFLAVMASGLYLGRGPGLWSAGLSTLAFYYFFLLPRFQRALGPSSYSRLAVFVGALLLVNYLLSAKRRSNEARRQSDEQARGEAVEARAAINEAFDEIQKSEDQLRLIINTIPTLAWSTRLDGSVEFFNRRWLEYTGLIMEQVLDWGWTVAIHPDDVTSLVDYWRSILASGEPGEIEGRLRRFDGEYRWFLFRSSPLRDEAGQVIRWYGTNTDIEDRKRAEGALRAREHNFRSIVDSIPGLVSTMTPTGEAELVNERVMQYTGKTLEEMRNWLPTIHPEDRALVASRWWGAVETGNPYDVEERIQRNDGVYRWFHARGLPLRDAEGHIVRWHVLLTDIEDRKRAEEALRASEIDLGLIVETIPALVWCAAPEGQVTYVNQRVLDYTGASLGSLAQAGWTNFLHPDDLEPTLRAWAHAIATGQPYEVQFRLRRSDGVYRWFQVLGQPLRDSEGHMARWYGLLIDIEGRKNMEEALHDTRTRLSRATQIATVGELAASIAHEVNQPLTAVVANGHACLRWLLAEPSNLAEAIQAAERIIGNGKSAAEIVRRIRALFRQAESEKTPLDLKEVLTEVVRLLKSETVRRGVVVETDLEEDLPTVMADRLQLQQVVFNLLQNGIDAMDTLTDRPKKLVIRSKRQSADTILIEIRDHGAGLNDFDKPFEAFYSTKENGMGMGLAICRSIIDAHHGRLWAAPTAGPGATFCFTLPLESRLA
jgi:PAS domain S-box-containing protein